MKLMNLAPVILFVFNRPEHTRKALKSLKANALAKDSMLYIFSDGPKPDSNEETKENVKKVREVIREEQWCGTVEIIETETNVGCAGSIINGITAVLGKYDRTIVIEDDLIVHHNFLDFINEALERYADDPRVLTVTGYQYPVKFPDSMPSTFFIDIASSWTWGTWRRAWNKFDPLATGWEQLKTDKALRTRFDFDNSNDFFKMLVKQMDTKEIDSWAIRWYWTTFRLGGLHLYPKKSLVENIGFDGTGVHKVNTNVNFSLMLKDDFKAQYPTEVKRNSLAIRYIINFWKLYYHHDLVTRIRRRIIRYFNIGGNVTN